jgi:hypothetical protein
LIVEEKIDGTNVGIHSRPRGRWCCNAGVISSLRECTRSTICSSSGRP